VEKNTEKHMEKEEELVRSPWWLYPRNTHTICFYQEIKFIKSVDELEAGFFFFFFFPMQHHGALNECIETLEELGV